MLARDWGWAYHFMPEVRSFAITTASAGQWATHLLRGWLGILGEEVAHFKFYIVLFKTCQISLQAGLSIIRTLAQVVASVHGFPVLVGVSGTFASKQKLS